MVTHTVSSMITKAWSAAESKATHLRCKRYTVHSLAWMRAVFKGWYSCRDSVVKGLPSPGIFQYWYSVQEYIQARQCDIRAGVTRWRWKGGAFNAHPTEGQEYPKFNLGKSYVHRKHLGLKPVNPSNTRRKILCLLNTVIRFNTNNSRGKKEYRNY